MDLWVALYSIHKLTQQRQKFNKQKIYFIYITTKGRYDLLTLFSSVLLSMQNTFSLFKVFILKDFSFFAPIT